MADDDGRRQLLLQMYDQMFNDIDAHLKVVWQSIAVVVGAFAIFSFVEKRIITKDFAGTLVVLIAAWLLANLIDAGYWYNRNLVIIANIEKEFLRASDLADIHEYFGAHRPKNKMFTHLRVQFHFGTTLALVVLAWHFLERIKPAIDSGRSIEPQSYLPYGVAALAAVYLLQLRLYSNRKYREFVRNSPGKQVDTSGIVYGESHGYPRSSPERGKPHGGKRHG